jgi:8-oxo-dGTP pyrophosphatase MutT (NUDIX family)
MNLEKRIPLLNSEYTTFHTNSYGAIIYARDIKSFLVVQRKHSYEFLLILRAMYRPSYLYLYIPNLHPQEMEHINCILREGKKYLYNLYKSLKFNMYHFENTLEMFEKCRDIYVDLLSKHPGKELSWTFPKGKMNSYEKVEDTIKREYLEEVELDFPEYTHKSSDFIEDIYIGLFNCTIHDYYYIYIIDNAFELPEAIDNPEVACRKWISKNELYNYKILQNTAHITHLLCLIIN